MTESRDYKHTCHTCGKPIIRGVYDKKYIFDAQKQGYTDDVYQEFMDDIRKQWQLFGLVNFQCAEMYCVNNHEMRLLGEPIFHQTQ